MITVFDDRYQQIDIAVKEAGTINQHITAGSFELHQLERKPLLFEMQVLQFKIRPVMRKLVGHISTEGNGQSFSFLIGSEIINQCLGFLLAQRVFQVAVRENSYHC